MRPLRMVEPAVAPDLERLDEFVLAGARVREYRRGADGWRYEREDGRVVEFGRTSGDEPAGAELLEAWREAA